MSAPALGVRGTSGYSLNGKPSFTAQQAAEQLTRSGARWGAPGTGPVTVTYAYRSSGDVPLTDGGTFSPFSAQQIAATELALKSWSDVANIRFQRVADGDGTYSNNASILFGNYEPNGDDPGAAFTLTPGNRSAASRSGDVWVRANIGYNANPVVGDYGQQVLVHEIGHAIGLSHPSDYDATDESDPTYAVNAAYYEDARLFTVMSYFASSNVGANLGAFAAAPQMDDIAAAQRLYGANTATRSGDTVYGSNSNADRPYYRVELSSGPLVFTVWDGGGFDRLDFSDYPQNQSIDLREGAFSNVGGWTKNVAIALGTQIEAANGGAGNDQIIAANVASELIGGGGADALYGGSGNDHLYGGAKVVIDGDGADRIEGGDGNDYIQGNAGADVLIGGSGSDRIYGGRDNDDIQGGAGNDSVNGNLGDDRISGGGDNDLLRGGQGDDQIAGDAGDDMLLGDLGSDTLAGGAGLDLLTGGGGADLFVSGGEATIDLIVDFEDGIDHLRLGAMPGQVLGGRVAASATAADVLAYAHQLLDAQGGPAAAAIGNGADTWVFEKAGADFVGVRLAGLRDNGLIGVTDFI